MVLLALFTVASSQLDANAGIGPIAVARWPTTLILRFTRAREALSEKILANRVPRALRLVRVTTVVSAWAYTDVLNDPVDAYVAAAYESFDAYYRSDYSLLIGFGFVLTGSRQLAEDLCQDALTEAHRKWHKINGYDDPGAWVRRVMVNKSRSRFRKLASEAKALTRLGAQPPEVVLPSERSAEVLEAVRALPARQSQAIALRYWEDRSIEEIASILGCGTETVKTHLKRGRASLAERLSESVDPESESNVEANDEGGANS